MLATTVLTPDGSTSSIVGANSDRRIWRYVYRYRWQYAGGFVFLLAATVLALIPTLLVKYALDDIKAAVDGNGDATVTTLLGYGGILILVALVEAALRYWSRLLVSGSSRRIEYQLREDLAWHLLSLDQGFYVQARTGDLMSRLTNDLQMVRDFLGPSVVDITRSIVVLLAGFAFMLVVDVRLTLISFAYLPFVIILMAYFETNIEKRFMEVQEQISELTERSQENVSGIRAIKAYAQEEAEIATFARENEEMKHRAMRLGQYEAGLLPSMVALSAGGTLLLLWFGGHDVVDGRISIGELAQLLLIMSILATQLMSVGWVVASAQMGVVAIRRINEVFRTPAAIADPARPEPFGRAEGHLELRGVSVRFGDTTVLHDIDLSIEAGTTVAIVGATGQGKTTLANLVPRLLDPSTGTVLLDGRDVRSMTLADLRRQVGFVPQESFLFSESLRENISYGREDAGDEAYEHALATSQLSNDLQQLGDGIHTIIGERGTTLSGGQKQRAAIARALLKDPPVLILDDALSHVDTHTEEEILRRLRTYMSDRTTLVIAHRTSTLRSADRIVVLEDGRIAEEGSHDDLLRLGGVYARIYREQLALEQREEDVDASLVEPPSDGARDDDRGGTR
ncbi:MAG: ABC transporter ATP-binding protein/permease [Dehalococcoidia bacterium]|nr:ABC transporter ATP-binding protein/permease [Dehalococcoidia bacterium]